MTDHIGRGDAHGVTEFSHKEQVRVSRRQAAERLVDLAYVLTTGRPIEISIEGQIVRVPVPDQLVLERESRSQGDRVELDLGLSWSSEPGAPA